MKETKELLSIVVPVFNAESTVERCIVSIVNQTYIDFELILVNDGSTDNSLKICNLYKAKDSRINVLDGPNEGVSRARNRGLDIARGSLWGFVDADDWIEPQHFELLVSGIKGFPKASMSVIGVVSDKWIKYLDILCEEKNDCLLPYERLMAEILGKLGLRGYLWNKLFYSTPLRLDEKISVCEDLEFVVRYLTYFKSRPAIIVNAFTYHYAIDQPQSFSDIRYGFHRSFSVFAAYEKITSHLKDFPREDVNQVKARIMHSAFEYLVAWNQSPKEERTAEKKIEYKIEHVKQYFDDNYDYGLDIAVGKERFEMKLFAISPRLAINYLRLKFWLKHRLKLL